MDLRKICMKVLLFGYFGAYVGTLKGTGMIEYVARLHCIPFLIALRTLYCLLNFNN